MKKVFSSNSDVAHIFAQRTQDEGRAGNIFFEGDTIYSYGYHFPIARFIDGQKVLFTLDSYSTSTSKHIGIVSSALTQYEKIYTYDVKYPHKSVERINTNIKFIFKDLAKARKPEIYINEILREVQILERLKSQYPKIKVYKKDYPVLYDLLKQGVNYFSPDVLDKVKENERKRKAKQRKAEQDRLDKWRKFEPNVTPPRGQEAYLRYNPFTNVVETSKNVKIEVKEAKALYHIWTQRPESLNGQSIIDGRYRVNRCNSQTLIAGCHSIKYDEATRIAKELDF